MKGLISTDTPGLYRLGETYWCKIRVKGVSRERSLKTTSKTTALAQLSRWRSEMEDGSAVTSTAKEKDLDRTVVSWLAEVVLHYKHNQKTSLKHFRYMRQRALAVKASWPSLMKRKPGSVTEAEIEAWQNRQLGELKLAPSTVKGNMLVLELAFKRAIRARATVTNPMQGMERPQIKKDMLSAKHGINLVQFEKLLATMRTSKRTKRHRAADLAELLVCSGLRVGEANRLVWANVDWEKSELSAPNLKQRKTRSEPYKMKTLPMFKRLKLILKKLWGDGKPATEQIAPVKQCTHSLATACKSLGFAKLTQHDLRHLFSCWSIRDGVDIPTVAAWLGHSDGGVLLMRNYNHFNDEHSKKMGDKVQ